MPGAFYDFLGNSTLKSGQASVYSPISLNQEWPKLGRLLFMVASCCFGSIMNGFFVSSFFVENSLRRIGNVYKACSGIVDLFLTGGVFPLVSVVLLSGEWDYPLVCKTAHFLTESSTYCYSLFSVLTAMENYFRICKSTSEYDKFLSIHVSFVSLIVTTVGMTLATFGVYYELDYSYCHRSNYGNPTFRLATYVIFHAIPCVVTVFCLTASSLFVKRRSRTQPQYRRSKQFLRDSATINLNIIVYTLFVAFWLPFLVICLRFPGASDAKFYICAWIGVGRSLITSCLYGLANQTFRRAYAHLFNYCFCKSTLTNTFTARQRRSVNAEQRGPSRPVTDVRVHILARALHSSPHRAAAAATTRDIYEL